MRQVTVTLESTAPYSQSRMHDTPKLDKETWDAHEARTWREKSTYNAEGIIEIPAMAFKQSLDRAAKVLGDQIPGKGKATYSKFFVSGVLCTDNVPLGIHKDEVPSVTINANSDGVRGSGKRVKRTFPQIAEWNGTAQFIILDDTITPEVFERTLTTAGQIVGIGRFRPENGGLNGRFRPTKFEWN
ncbi:MAG: hypothetical protein KDK71_06425 [Chlamydiia bacterium]|nr:hypothetical protein [Chlamydiia bacterium]